MKKCKILFALTILALFVFSFGFVACEKPEKGLIFKLDNGEYKIVGYTGEDTEVVIPSEYNGVPVTKIIKGAFSGCSNLTSVTIPDSVTSIGNSAFMDCSSLASVTIPNSVTSIGDYAFEGCSNLTNVTIPDSVTIIGGYAFAFCSSLTNITIPDSVTSIGNYAFYDCSSLTSVYYAGTSQEWSEIAINEYGNDNLTSATIYYYSETEPTEEGNCWHYDTDGLTPIVWVKQS